MRRRNIFIIAGIIVLLLLIIIVKRQITPPLPPGIESGDYAESRILCPGGTYSLVVDGVDRSYILSVPDEVPVSKVQLAELPIVIGLHGFLGSARQFARESDLERYAKEYGLIAVIPDGYKRAWNIDVISTSDKDDVKFIEMLISEVKDKCGIQASNAYLLGQSNGGIMAYKFAGEKSHLIKGIGVSGATDVITNEKLGITFSSKKPTRQINIVHVHGKEDIAAPFLGGPSQVLEEKIGAEITYTSFSDTFDRQFVLNECANRQEDIQDDRTLFTATCGNSFLKFIAVNGAEHSFESFDEIGLNPVFIELKELGLIKE